MHVLFLEYAQEELSKAPAYIAFIKSNRVGGSQGKSKCIAYVVGMGHVSHPLQYAAFHMKCVSVHAYNEKYRYRTERGRVEIKRKCIE